MHLTDDSPVGQPSFDLSDDQIATVIDLLCCSAAEARALLTAGMPEVPITIQVRKAMLRLKRQRRLGNLQITGEFELLDLSNSDPEVLGRIDIILQFLHQFGDEEAYLGVECKRVSPGDSTLNRRYVTHGVDRFVTGQYAAGHHWGMMLGYVLKLPLGDLIPGIDGRLCERYGDQAKLDDLASHPKAVALHTCTLSQGNLGHLIRVIHIFVDMTPAAPTSQSAV